MTRPDEYDAELLTATKETEKLRQQVLRVVRGDFSQICSYCGWEAPASGASWEELQAHIKECKEHPVYKLRQQVVAQQARLSAFDWLRIGVDWNNGTHAQIYRANTEKILAIKEDFSALAAHDAELLAARDAEIAELSAKLDASLLALEERDDKERRLESERDKLLAQVARLREALQFYADSNHFVAHKDVWESVSGEPENFLEDENNTATVEDGWVARNALSDTADTDACLAGVNKWISIKDEGLPDFRIYGFHTDWTMLVKYATGEYELVPYMGYGMFGKDNREDVEYYMPLPPAPRHD